MIELNNRYNVVSSMIRLLPDKMSGIDFAIWFDGVCIKTRRLANDVVWDKIRDGYIKVDMKRFRGSL